MTYFTGTADNDTYTGGIGNDGINGVGGDDVLNGDAGQDTLFGGDGHDWIDGGTGADILGGGMGNDTFVVDSLEDTVLEGTNQGIDLVRASVSFSLAGRQIEYLTLTGAAHINATGNGFNNLLVGNAGNNVLDGGLGADILQGGLGDDTYYVDHAGDNVSEAHWQGTDTIFASVSYSLFGRAVEILTLTGAAHIHATGNGLANRLTGNVGNNMLDGGAGADTLVGGPGNDWLDGGAGADTMSGSFGSDTYVLDDAGDLISDTGNDGLADTVYAPFSYTLGAGFENLTLTGSADINGTGNALANVFVGNAGINVFTGGIGDDTYYIQNAGDVVIDRNEEGRSDYIYSTVSYSLAGNNVENMVLEGSADINATGNHLSNSLRGNSGINVLTGGGGNDRYYIQNEGDTIVETGSGHDRVYSTVSFDTAVSVSHTGAFASVEAVFLSGSKALNAFGDAGFQTLSGNSGANILNGRGGRDILVGYGGADTFLFEAGSANDEINDFSRAENDHIDIHAYTNGVMNDLIVGQVGQYVRIDLGGDNYILVADAKVVDVLAQIIW